MGLAIVLGVLALTCICLISSVIVIGGRGLAQNEKIDMMLKAWKIQEQYNEKVDEELNHLLDRK